jgi:predicted dehydrogenase
MIAMQLGKAVYCEKPVCHDIGEAREMRAMAAKSKAPTQMGNQGHCENGYRSLCEYIWGGVIGKVTETHSWTDRANGAVVHRSGRSLPHRLQLAGLPQYRPGVSIVPRKSFSGSGVHP